MATKFVTVLKPTVLRVIENDREIARRVREGDGPIEIPADDFPGLRNTGRVAAAEQPAPEPTPKQRAKQRAAKAADAGKAVPSKGKSEKGEPAKDTAAA